MLQIEFETRVRVKVSPEEYHAIEVVYNNSELDKDEFCKLWVKMNKARVQEAIANEKAKCREEVVCDKLWRVLDKYQERDAYWQCTTYAEKAMTPNEIKLCQEYGILFERSGMAVLMSDILHELKARLVHGKPKFDVGEVITWYNTSTPWYVPANVKVCNVYWDYSLCDWYFITRSEKGYHYNGTSEVFTRKGEKMFEFPQTRKAAGVQVQYS